MQNSLPELPAALREVEEETQLIGRGPMLPLQASLTNVPGAIRLPQTGELVIYQLAEERLAMLGPSRIVIWKGTSVGQIIKTAKSMLQSGDTSGPTFIVEVEGGEVIAVVASSMATPANWVWSRV